MTHHSTGIHRILDRPRGTGSLLEYLPANADYVGYDLNPTYIESARVRYGQRARFFCARVGGEGDAAGETSSFDFVVAKSLLHHLSDEEAADLLATARRVLRQGGVFLSLDPARHEGQSIVT